MLFLATFRGELGLAAAAASCNFLVILPLSPRSCKRTLMVSIS